MMIDETFSPQCKLCGDVYAVERFRLGFAFCLPCGDDIAREVNSRRTVAPMHKSNYMLITNREDLIGLNNKGGIVK
jgi:ribosomal protein L37AE/L43A